MSKEAPVTYIIRGVPVPLKRPRFIKNRVWNSQKEIFQIYKIFLEGQHEGKPMYSGPLALNITFYFPLTGKLKDDRRPIHHKFKPDLDNLIKLVCDVSNGILFHDDSQIASITSKKVYDFVPRTEFTITELIK